MLQFKRPRVSEVNRIDTWTFIRDKKKTTTAKPILSLDLILMSILTRITEKELERGITKETNFRKFNSGSEKMTNASGSSGHQGENERQRIKSKQEHIQHFLHKTCNKEVSENFKL